MRKGLDNIYLKSTLTIVGFGTLLGILFIGENNSNLTEQKIYKTCLARQELQQYSQLNEEQWPYLLPAEIINCTPFKPNN